MQANQTAEAAECVIIRRESELRGLEGGNNRNALAGYSDLSAVTSGNGSVDKLRGSTISLFQGPASEQREREREREGERDYEACPRETFLYGVLQNARFASKSQPSVLR